MSIFDRCIVQSADDIQMRKTGLSLAHSLYNRPLTVVLTGELGAGKTTFSQGLAQGLGIAQHITSPTYALEQRYGDGILSHIDLYRLRADQAKEFVEALDDFPGIRVIEWGDRTNVVEAGIHVHITEEGKGRLLTFEFRDMPIPSDAEIDAWRTEAGLPDHIVRHCDCVAGVAERTAVELLAQGRIVRPAALRAAAKLHDLLRFVDFTSLTGDDSFTPTQETSDVWLRMQKKYGKPHEHAAHKFLIDKKYEGIGSIVRTHRGYTETGEDMPKTIEQMILAYSDKRAKFDEVVTLDERFDDFIARYGNGKEVPAIKDWRLEMRRVERVLFPDGAPF